MKDLAVPPERILERQSSLYEMIKSQNSIFGLFVFQNRDVTALVLPSLCTAAPPLPIFLRGGAAVHRLVLPRGLYYHSCYLKSVQRG